MIFGKHINRYYLRYAPLLLLGMAALVMVVVLAWVASTLTLVWVMLLLMSGSWVVHLGKLLSISASTLVCLSLKPSMVIW